MKLWATMKPACGADGHRHVGSSRDSAARAECRIYGSGLHLAGLKIGACFSHALASAIGHPFLFKGHDFVHTDRLAALT